MNRFAVSVFVVLTAACLFAFPSNSAAQIFTGEVVGVKDGDTIEVLRQTDRGPRPVTLRLHGIDTPETGQDYGTQAKNFTSDLVFGKTVTVQVVEKDRYGRTVAKVFTDGAYVNRELVQAGMAWWYEQYAANEQDLAAAHASAKGSGVGLWSQPNPVPPWEFRNGGSSRSSSSPPVNDKDCSDFSTQPEAQRFFASAGDGDPHNLDTDGDGRVCEYLPSRKRQSRPARRSRSCCKICRKGKACGDSCISKSYTCRQPPGCACNG